MTTEKLMKRFLSATFLLVFSCGSLAEMTVCPTADEVAWDKMSEKSFHLSSAMSALEKLKVYFNDPGLVVDEFVLQQLLVIRGGMLYKHYIESQGSEHHELYRQLFCEFMDKEAYLVH